MCATPRAVGRVVLTSRLTSSRGATVSSKTSIVQTPSACVQTAVLRSEPSRVSRMVNAPAPGVSVYTATGTCSPVRVKATVMTPFEDETSMRPSGADSDEMSGRSSVLSRTNLTGALPPPEDVRPRPKVTSMQPFFET